MRTTTFPVLALAVASPLLAQLLSTGRVTAQSQEKQGTERLTRADYMRPRNAIPWQERVPQAQWVSDGTLVEFREGKGLVWFDPVTKQTKPKPADEAAAAGADGDAPGNDRSSRRARRAAADARAPQGKVVLVRDGDLWLDDPDPAAGPRRDRAPSEKAVRLTEDGAAAGRKEEVHIAPDLASVSFVRGNNLFVVDVASKSTWQITKDGGPELFHGMLDWVYQEELYGRGRFQAHWWSPNASMLAFLSLDEAEVREFTIVNHVPEGFLDHERAVTTEVSNYPKAGDPNPFARLSVAHRQDKRVVAVDLSALPKDALIVRVDWTPDGRTLLATIQDRIQTWAELHAIDPQTGVSTKWIREDSPTWVNRPEPPRWLADGTFLWMSERTGYAHVYHYEQGGKLLSAITSGDWQVRDIERVDQENKVLWFEGTKDGATGRHLYCVKFDGSGLACVTPGIGTHSFQVNTDGTFVIDTWSAMDQPPKLRVLDRAGNVVKEVGQATKGAAEKYAFSEKQRVTIVARDGYELDASVMLPPDWKEGQRYAVYLPTYSGPDSPSVRDAWSHSTEHQFLAQQGFVILQVNVRSASGRGQQHTGTCYKQLGVQELKDLEDAVDHVCAKFGGDPARVAIGGWSYGGTITAYALTHSKKFALGLAGAGVHDWRLYDTIYTERYMRTPQENAAGYDAGSVIKAAKDLHGHLVLIHGSMDDNVHMQNTMQFVWELQKAGKQNFELMVYPRSRHGLNREVDAHCRELQLNRLLKLVEPPANAKAG